MHKLEVDLNLCLADNLNHRELVEPFLNHFSVGCTVLQITLVPVHEVLILIYFDRIAVVDQHSWVILAVKVSLVISVPFPNAGGLAYDWNL